MRVKSKMMKLNETRYTLDNSNQVIRRFLLISYVGILLSYIGYEYDPKFLHSYLVCYLFFTTLTLGGLFFVLANHIFGADWSISIRRFGENLMVILPLMLFMSAPIVINLDHLYEWTDPVPERLLPTKHETAEDTSHNTVIEKSPDNHHHGHKHKNKGHEAQLDKHQYENKNTRPPCL